METVLCLKVSAKTFSGFGHLPLLLGVPLIELALLNMLVNGEKKFTDALVSLLLSA